MTCEGLLPQGDLVSAAVVLGPLVDGEGDVEEEGGEAGRHQGVVLAARGSTLLQGGQQGGAAEEMGERTARHERHPSAQSLKQEKD